ncbi:hypothetical protein [Flexivirga meconopsidis]|uniref:hypothetical protein n=1 Tax=Flexivirga meconopsidis TaxID=2977121 RepID=UPI00223EDACC|nr:hypothetical protein [Flexivirga meconopsidis]
MSEIDQPDNAAGAAPVPGPPVPRQPVANGVDEAKVGPEPVAAQEDSPRSRDRFSATGDSQVDQALSGLPDPDVLPASDGLAKVPGEGGTDGEDSESSDGARGPDLAAHLDGQIADVTAVHRRLQQRLSDLSG